MAMKQFRMLLLIALLAISGGCMMMPMMHDSMGDSTMSDRHAAHHAGVSAEEDDAEAEQTQ